MSVSSRPDGWQDHFRYHWARRHISFVSRYYCKRFLQLIRIERDRHPEMCKHGLYKWMCKKGCNV